MSTCASSENEQGTHVEKEENGSADAAKQVGDTEASGRSKETGFDSESQSHTIKKQRQGTKRTVFFIQIPKETWMTFPEKIW